MSSQKLIIILVISVLISAMNCTQTQEKIHGDGICQYPENCTQPQLPPPSTAQPYGVPPPPKPESYPPPPSIPVQQVPTGYPPYAVTPPPPPAASVYPQNSPPPPAPDVEGQYSDSSMNPPPNPYTYLNETTNSAAPPSTQPLFPPTTVFYILFLFAYYV